MKTHNINLLRPRSLRPQGISAPFGRYAALLVLGTVVLGLSALVARASV